jgi:dipeptidase E
MINNHKSGLTRAIKRGCFETPISAQSLSFCPEETRMKQIRIVAIGGGGFCQGTDEGMETALLEWVGPQCKKIGFIGSASNNDQEKIKRFYARFEGGSYCLDHLRLDMDAPAACQWLESQDLLYIGGGNTLTLLDHWRTCGLETVLIDQALKGKHIAGVSAGANIWFEQALTDAGGQGLSAMKFLGLIPGSFCAHYDQEADRSTVFHRLIQSGILKAGFGLDDGVAALFSSSGFESILFARSESHAHYVQALPAAERSGDDRSIYKAT